MSYTRFYVRLTALDSGSGDSHESSGRDIIDLEIHECTIWQSTESMDDVAFEALIANIVKAILVAGSSEAVGRDEVDVEKLEVVIDIVYGHRE